MCKGGGGTKAADSGACGGRDVKKAGKGKDKADGGAKAAKCVS